MLGSFLVADVIGSPYYWAVVALITVAFSVVDFIALDPRYLGRKQGWAVALYIGSWVIVFGLSLPVAPVGSLMWVFPWGLRLAVTAVLIGSNLLAGAARVQNRATPIPSCIHRNHRRLESQNFSFSLQSSTPPQPADTPPTRISPHARMRGRSISHSLYASAEHSVSSGLTTGKALSAAQCSGMSPER